MTELSPDLFKDIGRNDPCPCGSGQKFKKCHEKSLKIQKVAEKKTRSAEQLIGSKTHAWNVYKLLQMVQEDNHTALFWELGHELGAFRTKFPTVESYLEATEYGTERLPASKDYDLRRMRVDGPDVLLLMSRGHNDPKTTNVQLDVVRLRPNEFDENRKLRPVQYRGFRIWSIQKFEKPKGDREVNFEDLGFTWEVPWSHPEEVVSPAAPMLQAVAEVPSETGSSSEA